MLIRCNRLIRRFEKQLDLMFTCLSWEIYSAFIFCRYKEEGFVDNGNSRVKKIFSVKWDETVTLLYSRLTKCISLFLSLELYFFQKVTFLFVVRTFAFHGLLWWRFCATGGCVDYYYKRLCLINYSVRIETELFCLYLYAFLFISAQPTLWIATSVYPDHQEHAQVQKRHAPRPSICAGPWELCHL